MISVIILTKNEEIDLPVCLNALEWSDDIHVLDSGSIDKTVEIAKNYNANVWYNEFESFGKQRNFALDSITIKNEWVLFLDADEVVTESFVKAIFLAVSQANTDVAGFYLCWKMILEGKW